MTTDRASVETFFRAVADCWAVNDGRAFGDLFVDDGSLINPFGERADGRAAIASMYREYFAGMLRGTTTSVELGTVRFVENEHAFADGEQTICAPDGTVVLAVHLATLLRRAGDQWRFVDSRPYTIPAPPAQ